MNDVFELYKKKNLIAKDRNCYIIKGKDELHKLGQRPEKANEVLESLIQEGKIEDLRYTSPSGSKDDTEKVSDKQDDIKSVETEPENQPKEPAPEKLTDKKDSEIDLTELEKADELMASKLGDISKRGKHGRFRVFINGVDSRSEKHPIVKAHKFVYRHCLSSKNVRSGDTVINDGYTVFTKQMNPVDPRTGKPRITVQRDDTPDGPFYTVGNEVLCYADKVSFTRRKNEQVLANTIKTAKTLDERQEHSNRMAAISNDPERTVESFSAYAGDHQASRAMTTKYYESKGMSEQEAQAQTDSLEEQITKAKHGRSDMFNTVRGQQTVNINSI